MEIDGDKAFDLLVEHLEKEIDGFRLGYKDDLKGEDWKAKVVGKVVGIFNKDYNTRYTTTLYPRVYFPTRSRVEEDKIWAFAILSHEYVHLFDQKRRRFWFPVSYLLPQILAVFSFLSLGAFWNLGFLWFLLFLLFLAPIPAPWRKKWEKRGYTMNILFESKWTGEVSGYIQEHILQAFVGWAYYKMWPFEESMMKEISERAAECLEGRFPEGEPSPEPYEVVKSILAKSSIPVE